jgi:hypothetical protein
MADSFVEEILALAAEYEAAAISPPEAPIDVLLSTTAKELRAMVVEGKESHG